MLLSKQLWCHAVPQLQDIVSPSPMNKYRWGGASLFSCFFTQHKLTWNWSVQIAPHTVYKQEMTLQILCVREEWMYCKMCKELHWGTLNSRTITHLFSHALAASSSVLSHLFYLCFPLFYSGLCVLRIWRNNHVCPKKKTNTEHAGVSVEPSWRQYISLIHARALPLHHLKSVEERCSLYSPSQKKMQVIFRMMRVQWFMQQMACHPTAWLTSTETLGSTRGSSAEDCARPSSSVRRNPSPFLCISCVSD